MVAAILFGSIGINVYRGHNADVVDKTVHKYAPVGASVAIIEHGEIKELRNYGYANKNEKKKVTDETRFKIASISKTVTAYGIFQLVIEEGTGMSFEEYMETEINIQEFSRQRVEIRESIYNQKYIKGIFNNLKKRPIPWNKIDGTMGRWEAKGFSKQFKDEIQKIYGKKQITEDELAVIVEMSKTQLFGHQKIQKE